MTFHKFVCACLTNMVLRRWLTQDQQAQKALGAWHGLCTSLCDLQHPASIAVLFHSKVARKKELVSHLWYTSVEVLSKECEGGWEEAGMKAYLEDRLNQWKFERECPY